MNENKNHKILKCTKMLLLALALILVTTSGTELFAADKAKKGAAKASAPSTAAAPNVAAPAPAANKKTYEPTDGNTQYTAVGKPSLLKIKGKIPQVKGEVIVVDDKKVSGKLSVELKGLDSGISYRDEHTRKYLEVEKFPNATLELKEMELPSTLKDMKDPIKDQKFTGLLTFHNETKPIEGTYTLERSGNTYTVKTQYTVMWPDYKIEIPVYAGITMQPKVDVETSFSIKIP